DDDVRAPQLLFNPEEGLARGYFPELQKYLDELPREEFAKSAADLTVYGKMLLARGDYDRAWRMLEQARDLESKTSRRAEIEWALSQGAILWNDFRSAHDYAESAVRDGYGLVPGFLRFLSAMVDVDVYAGPAVGESHSIDFQMRDFDLLRLPVRVNGVDSEAIVDSGAVYSIVTQSFARQAGVREIPDSKASGRGLHKKEFPVTFGVMDKLEFAGFSLRDVPVMLMPDDALLFQTSRGEYPVPAVLGLHLLKEFTMEIDYRSRRIAWTRADFRLPKEDPDQNLFLYRGRLFVRASINRNGFFPFLLDTGSEPTMMTSVGLTRARLKSSNALAPRKVHGMGKSKVEWERIGRITIGVGGFAVRFRDLIVQKTDAAFEAGVIGTSFLKNFRVRVDFARMILRLENTS
ncbi:MAG: pepsin/retropepsin-like aspartic protease family protein, partial [Acidobacteriota bacterium]